MSQVHHAGEYESGEHRRRCTFHERDAAHLCWGSLRSGSRCFKNTVMQTERGLLPVCRTHRLQKKLVGKCRAVLECGFECGTSFEWKPHGFQLCPGHEYWPKPCYFLDLPTEIRMRVYQELLPNLPIPARYANQRQLRSDREPVCATILRVNQQVHDEAADLLYRQSTFQIDVFSDGAQMCNRKQYLPSSLPTQFSSAPGTPWPHINDYQMQLMLLEQQNKKRLLMSRQEQGFTGRKISSSHDGHATSSSPLKGISSDTKRGNGPIWQPTISTRYFNQIRSFEIKIFSPYTPNTFPQVQMMQHAIHHSIPGRPMMTMANSLHGTNLRYRGPANNTFLATKLYELCDELHSLVGRLDVVDRPIQHLKVSVNIDHYEERGEAVAAAQMLLRPFRRLRGVLNPTVDSVTWLNPTNDVVPLRTDGPVQQLNDKCFDGYLRRWRAELSLPKPGPEPSPVTSAYWVLKEIVSDIQRRCLGFDDVFQASDLQALLHRAKVAREADDVTGMQEVSEEANRIWNLYLDSHKQLVRRVSQSTALMGSIINDESTQSFLLESGAAAKLLEAEGNGKGKRKAEDDEAQTGAVVTWINEDGTRYSKKDGKIRVELLTPALVREARSVRRNG